MFTILIFVPIISWKASLNACGKCHWAKGCSEFIPLLLPLICTNLVSLFTNRNNAAVANATILLLRSIESTQYFKEASSRNEFKIAVDACFQIIKLTTLSQNVVELKIFLRLWSRNLFDSTLYGGLKAQYANEEKVSST